MQSMTRAPLGMETAMREPTSVMRPSRTMTTASAQVFRRAAPVAHVHDRAAHQHQRDRGRELGHKRRWRLRPGKRSGQNRDQRGPSKRRRESRIRKSGLVWIVAQPDCRSAAPVYLHCVPAVAVRLRALLAAVSTKDLRRSLLAWSIFFQKPTK